MMTIRLIHIHRERLYSVFNRASRLDATQFTFVILYTWNEKTNRKKKNNKTGEREQDRRRVFIHRSIQSSRVRFTFSRFYFSSNETSPQGPASREEPSRRFVRFHRSDFSDFAEGVLALSPGSTTSFLPSHYLGLAISLHAEIAREAYAYNVIYF